MWKRECTQIKPLSRCALSFARMDFAIAPPSRTHSYLIFRVYLGLLLPSSTPVDSHLNVDGRACRPARIFCPLNRPSVAGLFPRSRRPRNANRVPRNAPGPSRLDHSCNASCCRRSSTSGAVSRAKANPERRAGSIPFGSIQIGPIGCSTGRVVRHRRGG